MLNPSTADASHNDPTIKRCIQFATSWGHTGLVVANLYAFRTPKPQHLFKACNPVGRKNEFWLKQVLSSFETIACGWGEHAKAEQVHAFMALAENAQKSLWCLGKNKSGMPKHPLYVKACQPLVQYE